MRLVMVMSPTNVSFEHNFCHINSEYNFLYQKHLIRKVYLRWLLELFGIASSECRPRDREVVLLLGLGQGFRLGGDVELLEGLQAAGCD